MGSLAHACSVSVSLGYVAVDLTIPSSAVVMSAVSGATTHPGEAGSTGGAVGAPRHEGGRA
jgi:hypothetical protein